MNVFMVGWEFPPFISGGLGTACYGLVRAMDEFGVGIVFVLPRAAGFQLGSGINVRPAGGGGSFSLPGFEHVSFLTVESVLQAYMSPERYQQEIEQLIRQKRCGLGEGCQGYEMLEDVMHYGGDMYSEVYRYAEATARLAMCERFDVVHAHDWMTFPAGMAASAVSGKPLVVQVHSTEFDRSGEHVNQQIYEIERAGMHAADRVIAVSQYTRNMIMDRYGVPGEKIEVVYNGVEPNGSGNGGFGAAGRVEDEKIVLFVGRITMQKGPEYFLSAAKKVLEVNDNVRFVMAGAGDMMYRTIELAAEMGIGHKVSFTGFLQGDELGELYQMADLYVMPSVSEPFGIAPLEALNHDVPVLISKQSGVSEVLPHALKVDFWDIREMANKILAVLKYSPLEDTLREQGTSEVKRLGWRNSARRCLDVYGDLVSQRQLMWQ